ncbi:hypothetical protein HMF8227_01862 [Saliniradius amylolyticus]|uniref:Co-chaperone DjlA N-terminal domain-containing protein n=1 Tax=Saliniradius amylolyticus TaxID=2183582 RepID=A0A2S2E496_9ALTE|nr:TerB family tellurite resistance protein [Saliniradius amylolyticus]AWL12332.1 hypothetical protein HMF8227_01862 [Saliniradius amylolyticus]
MIKSLKNWVEQLKQEDSSDQGRIKTDIATAVLYMEVIRADSELAEDETQMMHQLLVKQFNLSDKQAEQLLHRSGEHTDSANDMMTFTRVLNDSCDAEQKQTVMVNLWKLALADGQLDKHEEHTIRRIADLLYVPHSKFIQSKLNAREQSE